MRHLSIIKEAKGTSPQEITRAENRVEELQQNMGEPSEMALIRNLHWWTVEYGLIGSVENPKIYGAGLLSSIGESAWCMTDKVKKLRYSIEAAHTSFDITKPQPQLFVTPDFAFLSQVLEDFANTMALRTGGLSGIQKLIDSKELGTIELSTGLQISGNFEYVIAHEGKPIYFQTSGKSALAFREKELVGQDTNQHATGFGSPIGRLKGINITIEEMSPRDLKAYKIYEGELVSLDFEGGINVSGKIITGTRNLQGQIILITFENCKVTHRGKILFQSEKELYNMAIGEHIVSACNGPADLKSFNLMDHELSKTISNTEDGTESELENYYKQIREFREGKNTTISRNKVFAAVKEKFPKDWLLAIELYELAVNNGDEGFAQEINQHLESVKQDNPKLGHLIDDGLALTKPIKVD